MPASALATGAHIWLDLGDVRELAAVTVNGKDAGIAWKTPFKSDISGLLIPGANQISIQVTNLWVNRLIEDRQPGAVKIAITDFSPYGPNASLLPSGLMGAVHLVSVTSR